MTEGLHEALRALAADPSRHPLLVALDFDGVLAPLQDDPSASRILPDGVVALDRLMGAGVRLALISGRDLTTLATLAQVPVGTVLIGSHGAERARVLPFGLDRAVAPLTAEQADLLAQASAQLSAVSRGRNGVWVEAKPSAAVVHTRLAQPDIAEQALAQARTVGTRLGVHVIEGKNVVELSVLDADKGTALLALRHDLAVRAVLYAGDDLTDENALVTLGAGDIGVKVGPGGTVAAYRVDDPDAFVAALGVLADALDATP
ncbi:MAG: trehalose-phosphatase [Actinobacteria bacterium]|nr:trehalose-phosphatase [Actinomycetota bacterium]MBU4335257.1 trehalose-phosphatase [Actinomycetota bacterium]MCG2801275.1 trehalose-phosphatase [Cellulomonas sp.]